MILRLFCSDQLLSDEPCFFFPGHFYLFVCCCDVVVLNHRVRDMRFRSIMCVHILSTSSTLSVASYRGCRSSPRRNQMGQSGVCSAKGFRAVS